MSEAGKPRSLRRGLKSSSRRTFVVYPLGIFAFAAALQGGMPEVVPWAVALLVWGYVQYRMVGNYRMRLGKGGPGIDVPPERIVAEGPYRYVRNPMYVGHLLFMLGLALTFRSWPALALFAFHVVWFNRRVIDDEVRLEAKFGAEYLAYKARVKRWIPGVI